MTQTNAQVLIATMIISSSTFITSCSRPLTAPINHLNSEKTIMEQIDPKALQDGTEVFFVFSNQQFIEATTEIPKGFYIKGAMAGGKFAPSSGVLGIDDLATSGGRYGWLELNSQQFFPMESDQEAQTPFVKGYLSQTKTFLPSHREVFQTP